MQNEQIIIGIDPGTRITGYGIIKLQGARLSLIDFGTIRPPATLPLPERYYIIFQAIEKLIHTYQPMALSVETQFVNKNAQSALKLGMARGSILIAATKNRIPIYEYAPKKAKLAVVGSGKASKYQIGQMVQILLRLKAVPSPEDAADALALAICHANNINHLNIYKRKVFNV